MDARKNVKSQRHPRYVCNLCATKKMDSTKKFATFLAEQTKPLKQQKLLGMCEV